MCVCVFVIIYYYIYYILLYIICFICSPMKYVDYFKNIIVILLYILYIICFNICYDKNTMILSSTDRLFRCITTLQCG